MAKEKRPTVIIRTKPLLESLSHLHRQHVGSALYAPRISPPPCLNTSTFAKFPFATQPGVLPRFEPVDWNCTFTVKVPRFYLSDASREHIVLQRKVWGTDVYTDDSDPIAAAIHNGWIRGAWGEDVDVGLLEDLELGGTGKDSQYQSRSQGTAEDEKPDEQVEYPARVLKSPPPSGPITPLPDHDARITLLILPALEKYAPSTWHGIRSRAWAKNHDGMSFKIHKVEWVDERPESGWESQGRASATHHETDGRRARRDEKAEARRQRLRDKWKGAPPSASWTCSSDAMGWKTGRRLGVGLMRMTAVEPVPASSPAAAA